MTRTIEFYYDFVSPYSYLAFTQLPAIAARAGATIAYKPIDVLEVMKRVGNAPTTVLCHAKGRYARADLGRWVKRYGVPFAPNPHFRNMVSRPLLLGAIAAGRLGQSEAYARAVFEGVWVRQAGFADDVEMLSVLQAGGFEDGEAILRSRDDMADELEKAIADAVDRGVFGVPSFIVGDALFFGNDRLDFLAAELER